MYVGGGGGRRLRIFTIEILYSENSGGSERNSHRCAARLWKQRNGEAAALRLHRRRHLRNARGRHFALHRKHYARRRRNTTHQLPSLAVYNHRREFKKIFALCIVLPSCATRHIIF